MFKKMERKKTSKQLIRISSKKKLYTPSYKEYKKIISEVKIMDINSKKDKLSAPTSNVNSSEDDKALLKTEKQNIKKKKKVNSKVQSINILKNHNAAVLTEKRHYSQIKECFVLLSDCNEHKKIHKSNKASTSNSTNISSMNDNVYSSILKTQEQNIKKIKKVDSKIQSINNLKNHDAAVLTEKIHYSQINDCFVLLSDVYEHKKINKSNKAASSNNTKMSSENDKVYSILKTQEKKIKKYKVKKKNNLKNDHAAVYTEKRHYSQINECFVLLSDVYEHEKINKANKASTSNNPKISSENDKVYSSTFKTQEKNIKKCLEDSKVQNINSLKNHNAAVRGQKRNYSQINECFVLLSDCNQHKKIHKTNKAFTSNNSKISSENDKVYSSTLKTQKKKIVKKYKVKKKKNLNNYHVAVHTEKRHYSQLKECFVLLSDFNEHK